jgi:hypothetical protein
MATVRRAERIACHSHSTGVSPAACPFRTPAALYRGRADFAERRNVAHFLEWIHANDWRPHKCTADDWWLFKRNSTDYTEVFKYVNGVNMLKYFHFISLNNWFTGHYLDGITSFNHFTSSRIAVSISMSIMLQVGCSSRPLILFVDIQQDSFYGWSARRKASTYTRQQKQWKLYTSMPCVGCEPTIRVF